MLARLVSLSNPQKWSSATDMSHESWKNVTEPRSVSQLTTSCLCDHRVTVLEVVGVSAVECVPLLLENRILFCWVPHRKSWLHFFPAFDWKRIRYWCLIMVYLSLTVTCMSSIVTGLYSCTCIIMWRGCNPREYRSYVLTVTSSGSLGYSASRPHFARTIETPLCVRARHLSPHSVPPSTPLLLSLLLSGLSRLIPPPCIASVSTVPPVFVCAFVFPLICLHACLWFLYVCVCLHQKSQPHRDERGAMGQHAGPGSCWGHTQHTRAILPGSGAAPRQTLPGLILERGGNHPPREWRNRTRLQQKRLQTVRR